MDRQSKLFFGCNDRFADLINGSLFHGKNELSVEDLTELDSESNEQVKEEVINRRRDLLKRCKKSGTVYAVFGAEMQSTEDKNMPVRIMTYDSLFYSHLIHQKKKLVPVVTLCLYTGEGRWTEAVSLYEMMNVPEELKGIVQDYRIQVIDAVNTDISRYTHPEVREFFELFQDIHKLNRIELENKYSRKQMKSIDAVKTALTLGRCMSLKDKMIIKNKEGQEMCRNFDRIVEEWKAEGEAKGRAEGEAKGRTEESLMTIKRLCEINADIDLISTATGLSVFDIRSLINQHQIPYPC